MNIIRFQLPDSDKPFYACVQDGQWGFTDDRDEAYRFNDWWAARTILRNAFGARSQHAIVLDEVAA